MKFLMSRVEKTSLRPYAHFECTCPPQLLDLLFPVVLPREVFITANSEPHPNPGFLQRFRMT